MAGENDVPFNVIVGDDAETKIKRITAAATELETKGNKAAFNFSRAFETAAGVVAGSGMVEALEFAYHQAEKLFDFLVTDAIHAAEEAEVAQNRLNQALALAGNYSRETAAGFAEFAKEIQRTTTYEDDAVLSSIALLESLTQLDEEGLKAGTKAALDMSAALGIDLDTAIRMVGKAANGETAAFGKLGIQIEQGETKAETYANTLEVLARFAGSAEGKLNTFRGAVTQLLNMIGDLQEETGGLVVKNGALVSVIREASKMIEEYNEVLASSNGEAKSLAAEGIIAIIDGLAAITFTLDPLGRLGVGVFNALAGAVNAFGLGLSTVTFGVFAPFLKLLSMLPGDAKIAADALAGLDDMMRSLSGQAANVNANADAINKALAGQSDAAKRTEEILLRLREAAANGFAAMKDGAESGTEPINAQKKAVDELTASQIALGEAGQKVAERLVEKDPQKKYAADLEALTEANAQGLELAVEYEEALRLLRVQRDLQISEQNAKEIDDLLKKNEFMRLIDEDKYAKDIAANRRAIDKIAESEKGASTASLKVKADQVRREQQLYNERIQAAQGVFAEVTALTGKETAAYKAAAIAQTVISTYTGASKAGEALAGIPIIGPALAAAAIATYIAGGIARVATITGTPLATGIDEVPGFGTRDNFPALLTPGERVVPRETNRELKEFLAGGGPMIDILQSIDNKLSRLSPQVTVNLDGRAIFDSVREQLRSGRVFA